MKATLTNQEGIQMAISNLYADFSTNAAAMAVLEEAPKNAAGMAKALNSSTSHCPLMRNWKPSREWTGGFTLKGTSWMGNAYILKITMAYGEKS